MMKLWFVPCDGQLLASTLTLNDTYKKENQISKKSFDVFWWRSCSKYMIYVLFSNMPSSLFMGCFIISTQFKKYINASLDYIKTCVKAQKPASFFSPTSNGAGRAEESCPDNQCYILYQRKRKIDLQRSLENGASSACWISRENGHDFFFFVASTSRDKGLFCDLEITKQFI